MKRIQDALLLQKSHKFKSNHTESVNCLVVLPNGYLASGSNDRKIKIWDTNTGIEMRTLEGHTAAVSCLVVLQNGYLASGWDETIQTYSVENNSD